MTRPHRHQRRVPVQPTGDDDLASGPHRADTPVTAERPDAAEMASGSPTHEGDDTIERKQPRDYEADKWERGPAMPH